jgi:hypothetical protein
MKRIHRNPGGRAWLETHLRVTGVDLRVCPRCEGLVDRVPFVNAAQERALRERLDELDRLANARAPHAALELDRARVGARPP